MGFEVEVTELSREFRLAKLPPAIRAIDDQGTWVRAFNEDGYEVEVKIHGLTPKLVLAELAPVLPINPADYRPSAAVNLLCADLISDAQVNRA